MQKQREEQRGEGHREKMQENSRDGDREAEEGERGAGVRLTAHVDTALKAVHLFVHKCTHNISLTSISFHRPVCTSEAS